MVLCDTNGASFGDRIAEATAAAVRAVRVPVGIHCHNDCGLAVANALAAMQAGARQIQGTLLGFGERCGNTNLSTVIGVLQAKRGVRCIPADQLCRLTPTAAYVAEIANLALDNAMPFVGKSAFAHKGGMHADGVLKNPASFEHMLPQTVGNSRSILLSEQSGRSALLNRLSAVVPGLTKGSEELRRLSELLKERELDGYMYEACLLYTSRCV